MSSLASEILYFLGMCFLRTAYGDTQVPLSSENDRCHLNEIIRLFLKVERTKDTLDEWNLPECLGTVRDLLDGDSKMQNVVKNFMNALSSCQSRKQFYSRAFKLILSHPLCSRDVEFYTYSKQSKRNQMLTLSFVSWFQLLDVRLDLKVWTLDLNSQI